MDIESIKLISETVKTLGTQGQSAFIWWIAVDFAKFALAAIGWTIFAIFAMKWGLRALLGREEAALLELRSILQVGSPGKLIQEEINDIIAVTRNLKEKSRSPG